LYNCPIHKDIAVNFLLEAAADAVEDAPRDFAESDMVKIPLKAVGYLIQKDNNYGSRRFFLVAMHD
jgi:hypothetical protein